MPTPTDATANRVETTATILFALSQPTAIKTTGSPRTTPAVASTSIRRAFTPI
jgi:hypothetical protein